MKYTPKYKIKSVKFTHKGEDYDVEGSKVLSGIYQYAKGGKLQDYTYIPKNRVKEFITDDGSVKKHSNGVWVLSSVLKSEPTKTAKKPAKVGSKTSPKSEVKKGALVPPSVKYKGKKNMPVSAFEVAEEMVAMKKAKAKISSIRSKTNLLDRKLQDNKDFKEWHEPLAYTILWYNANMPLNLAFDVLGGQEYYGEGVVKAFKEEFKKAPDVTAKVSKIKRGSFMSNSAEQKLSKSFVSKDTLRPQMMHTYIDNGYAVSTNAHILLGIYDKSLVGKEEFLTDPKTSSSYPNWRQVLPNTYSTTTKKINAQRLYDFLLKAKKYNVYPPIVKGIVIKINDDNNFGFNIDYITQSLKAIMKLGDSVYLHYEDLMTRKAIILTNIENWSLDKDNSSFALTMPIMVDRTYDNYISYDLDGDTVFAKGGKVSDFDKLANKVAKQYKGKKVPSKYQSEYGKMYSPEEAQEVGRKVAYKVMMMQEGKKMAKGGRTISIVNDGVKFDKSKYKAVYGDFDKDGTVNIDDANPLDATKNSKVEQVELKDTFDKLLSVKAELDDIMYDAVDTLDKKAPKDADIYARTKTPYSILKKLVDKRMLDPNKGLTDMIGTTIAVGNQKELEQVRDDIDGGLLGKVLDRDDYYKNPKAGYRAYHYIVEYDGVPVEVQLKTKRMKKLNEVSHDFYKKGTLDAKGLDAVSKTFEKADRGDKKALAEVNKLLSDKKALASKISTSKMAKGGAIKELRKQKDIDIYEDVMEMGGDVTDSQDLSIANADNLVMKTGGALPKGYHRMPDGTVMKDSEHMAKGGKTKKRKTGTKKPNSFFAVVKRNQRKGEAWKDAIQRVKKEMAKK